MDECSLLIIATSLVSLDMNGLTLLQIPNAILINNLPRSIKIVEENRLVIHREKIDELFFKIVPLELFTFPVTVSFNLFQRFKFHCHPERRDS